MKAVKNIFSQKGIITFLIILLLSGSFMIFSINKPHDFNDGDLITANEMNANFDALYEKVTEMEAMIGSGPGSVPVGTIVAFGGNADSVPSGWLLCDGTPYSGTDYPELYVAIGKNYGSMGGNIFNVPDLRGMFLRGVDGGAGNDPDAAIRTANGNGETDAPGSVQEDAIQEHQHQAADSYCYGEQHEGKDSNHVADNQWTTSWNWTQNYSAGTKTSSETRPKNVYVNYIIKY
jgi:microcystin-dependent protein